MARALWGKCILKALGDSDVKPGLGTRLYLLSTHSSFTLSYLQKPPATKSLAAQHPYHSIYDIKHHTNQPPTYYLYLVQICCIMATKIFAK